jgi:hypothetical protein
MKKLIGKLNKIFEYRYKKRLTWKEIEYFNPNWKIRINQMYQHVKYSKSIVDYGCGKMWLKELLKDNVKYYGVDYTKRDESTVICDFNMQEHPMIYSDSAFVSGCLEYVKNHEWFISEICTYHESCVLSYCTTDNFGDISNRRSKTWVNDLNEKDIISLFNKNGFMLECLEPSLNTVFYFKKEI